MAVNDANQYQTSESSGFLAGYQTFGQILGDPVA